MSVSDEMIEQAWNAVSDAVVKGTVESLMSAFMTAQSEVMEFLSEGAGHWSEDGADIAFHAALVIWMSFRAEKGKEPEALSAECLIENYRKNVEWLESQSGEALLLQKKMTEPSRFAEPQLMRYLIESVFEAHEDGMEIEPDEQQQLFLTLKTVVDSFHA